MEKWRKTSFLKNPGGKFHNLVNLAQQAEFQRIQAKTKSNLFEEESSLIESNLIEEESNLTEEESNLIESNLSEEKNNLIEEKNNLIEEKSNLIEGDSNVIESNLIEEKSNLIEEESNHIESNHIEEEVITRQSSNRAVGDEHPITIITRQISSNRAVGDEHPITIRQKSSRSRSSDPETGNLSTGPPAISAQTPEANDHYVQSIWGFVDLASAFNWGVVVLALGSYGLLLSTSVFWLCWSILVTEAVIFYSIRPYWNWIETPTGTTDQSAVTRKPHHLFDHGRAGAIFLKIGISIALITMLLYNQDLTQRQTKILLVVALSIILVEGFPPILILREELKSLMRSPSGKRMQMISYITGGHNWNAVNFLTPSVINAMIGVTGAIILGGNLGSLMPQKSYWVCVSILVVDLLAELIHRFDCGRRRPFDIPGRLPKIHYIAIILRLVVEGCLCYWLTKEIFQNSYFPSHVDIKACNGQCQERSKELLITVVVLGGLQAAGTFITPICSFFLGPHYVPCFLLAVVLFMAYMLFLFTYKLLRGLIHVIKKICI